METAYLFGRNRDFIGFLLSLLLDELYHLVDLTLDLRQSLLRSGIPQHEGACQTDGQSSVYLGLVHCDLSSASRGS